MISARMRGRLARHHLPLAVLTAAAGYALFASHDDADLLGRLSFASAWPALLLLTATLLIGPWRALHGKRPAVSLDLRRDIGIWAGMTGILHAVIGQCVHLRGRPWLYYIYEKWRFVPLRHDLFGFANHTGLIAAVILALLLATSNDHYLRRLGNGRWKGLQRWNYGCFVLAALHSFGYLLGIESLKPALISVAILCVLATLLLQSLAWRRKS